jgi:putative addiction module component (TIGR02574 family)
MPVTMKELGIDKLSVDDRVLLAHEIWESINADSEAGELSPELRAELERRLADDDARPDMGVAWNVVFERALKRAGR